MIHPILKYLVLIIGISASACNPTDRVITHSNDSQAQSFDDRISRQVEADLKHYFLSLNNDDIDQVVNMTYPKLFGSSGIKGAKENYIRQKMQGLSKKVELKQIDKVSPLIEADGNYYAIVNATGNASVVLSNNLKESRPYIKSNFELSYDSKCTSESESELMINDAHIQFIAISEKGSNFFWQYIEVDRQKLPYYNQIIPEEVLSEI